MNNGNYLISQTDKISLFDSQTNKFIRKLDELDGQLENIVGLSYANNKLLISDDGPNKKCATVYHVNDDVSSSINPIAERIINAPAEFGKDDPIEKCWHMIDSAIDNEGNVIICKRPPIYRNSDGGGQIIKFGPGPDNKFIWQKYALAYVTAAVAGPPSDPGFVIGSNLRQYKVNFNNIENEYMGSLAYPGYETLNGVPKNDWSSVGSAQSSAPMRWATIENKEFLACLGHMKQVFLYLKGLVIENYTAHL